jgi:hypothetical protein
MKRNLAVGAIVLVTLMVSGQFSGDGVRAADPPLPPELDGPVIDLAICLDTSGSMEPLIDAARVALWDIAGEIAQAEPTPRLRVALLTYGVKSAGRNGWVRMETELTEDLDLVAERLFALRSEKGGVEYVGRVLQMALDRLDWTESEDALKLIFVAGNEPADQDPAVSFLDVSDAARDKDIFVHAIFYGDAAHADATTWKELSELTEGTFASVDPRSATMVVKTKTPFDRELGELGTAINETYLPLGEEGRKRWEELERQDRNARKLSPTTAARRSLAKAGRVYSSRWDLVVEEMQGRREDLRRRIAELSAQRRLYVSEKLQAKGLDAALALDGPVRRAIRLRLEEEGLYLSQQ